MIDGKAFEGLFSVPAFLLALLISIFWMCGLVHGMVAIIFWAGFVVATQSEKL